MSELGLVLFALFLFEGLRWVPRRSVAFSVRPWGGFACRRPGTLRNGARRGLLLPEPWIPAMERFVAHVWPFALSPAGIAFTGSAEKRAVRLEWGGVGQVGVKGSRLTVDGRAVAEAGSSLAAHYLGKVLHRIARASAAERETLIRAAITENFDALRARERLEGLRRALAGARWLAWLLTANLLITGPLVADAIGRARVWPVWVAAHVVLTVLAVRVVVKATRQMGGLAPESRLETLFTLVLFPPATARFLETVTPDALTGLDPLACAAVVLDSARFARMVRNRLGELESFAANDEIANWFRTVVREEILLLAEREGLQRDAVLAAPSREPGSAAFCPGCRAQYRSGCDFCAECPGVVLVRFPGGSGGENGRVEPSRRLATRCPYME